MNLKDPETRRDIWMIQGGTSLITCVLLSKQRNFPALVRDVSTDRESEGCGLRILPVIPGFEGKKRFQAEECGQTTEAGSGTEYG